ncbi:MAG: sensor domain-containing diguanylate cyclase [Eubacteriales bacterium]|nr:sensor domain-containing diguanylate cyclase [Eubacteriales bacterium]
MEKDVLHSAEQLLEQIFHYMSQLVNEKRFSKTLELLTELGRTLVHCDRASFWYWDKNKHQYWTLTASGRDKIVVPEGTGIVGATIANQETICINSPYEDERFNASVDKESGYVTRSILCFPITNEKGHVIGAFQAINKMDDEGNPIGFEKTDEKRLAMVAVFCGKTLESHLLYEQAQIDQLTGLKNRRGFYDYYVQNFDEHTKQASIVMCDIDFFKKVNDTYGHNAGDAVLMHVADILLKNLPNGGEVVRWGGEEFVFLLNGIDVQQAVTFAENIRKQMEQTSVQYDNQVIQITMSFGVAPLLGQRTSDENVKQADDNLYQAKQNGRNRVVYS